MQLYLHSQRELGSGYQISNSLDAQVCHINDEVFAYNLYTLNLEPSLEYLEDNTV